MDNETIWKIIDSHFRDNPQTLVRHHIDSYNDFFKNGIFRIMSEKNPVQLSSKYDEKTKEYKSQCLLYFGGKDGKRIYFGKPVIYDENNAHYMFPNEARLRNMTYGMTIHYDVEVEFIDILEPGQAPTVIGVAQNVGGGEAEKDMEYADSDYFSSEGGKESENFKTRLVEKEEQGQEQKEKEFTGGAPKATAAPKKRGKKEAPLPFALTPQLAAQLREAAEQSMVNPSTQRRTLMLEKIYLGKFPIMLQSDFCILSGLSREVRHTMGECRNDLGGYFIIDGKEKSVVPQEKFADNMLYIRKMPPGDAHLGSAEIKSVSENVSKPRRTLSVKMVAPSGSFTNGNIVVNIPNVRKPVPLFIVFRALGVLSDKDIISYCLLDMEKYESMVDMFIPSVHDGASMMSQVVALKYIASLTKGKTTTSALEILADYFLPHVGEMNYIHKAYYLGHMTFRMLAVMRGIEPPTDRDHFKYKRIELTGALLYDLFREYYAIQQRQIHVEFEKRLYYNQSMYEDNLYGLIQQNYRDVFRERLLETGFRRAFKGNWGAQTHTKRIGIVQDLNRLSFNSALNQLRKTNLPLPAGVKLVGPRVLHNSQWGYIDPIDTPDGGSIGLHKHLSISTYVTRNASREPLLAWLRERIGMKRLEDYTPKQLASLTKMIVNGHWAGVAEDPVKCVQKIRLYRRNALLPIYFSAAFDIATNTITMYTDAGRVCRPVFYRDEYTKKASYQSKEMMRVLAAEEFRWSDLVTGWNEKRPEAAFDPADLKIYELFELYQGIESETNPAKIERFLTKKAILDYVDPSESEQALVAMFPKELESTSPRNKYTHSEIHESLIMGMMCNQIIFPENNPAIRNSFSCGQSKQACSVYSTNYQVRMDKASVLLNYGQVPLVKPRYLDYIQKEEHPYGENAIVAIMCHTGYNVEDAMLINEGALKRGLFRTTYFTTYEAHEESTKNADTLIDTKFTNIESEPLVVGTKPGYDYSKLDRHGLIKEGEQVTDKTVLIGLTSNSATRPDARLDGSKGPKKGQLGIVDKTFITEGEEGQRIAKVRLLEQRIPSIGDKMASRAGQKGTIGMVVKEADMPFTRDGIRPDIIINPHAIPTRMTLGQLVECITGKACAMYGAFGNCTAFENRGTKNGVFGELLTKSGFHSSGNEIMYNGMTGEQMEMEIFMGPTYYMRLKHMVKDKINHRALGPRSALTTQPVGGRANDGGLRIGEMERDSVIGHGMTDFLRESMMERGDKYYVAICNKTGMLSIYNPDKKLFMSPMADGPIRFEYNADNGGFRLDHVTQFGRDFSVVCVPFSFKLFIQELQTINVQMRIITEDNIEQLENMSYSDNLKKLTLNPDMTPELLVKQIKRELTENRRTANALFTPVSAATPYQSPEFVPTSPAYVPPATTDSESLVYGDTDSPIYNPNSPVTEGHRVYEPTTPDMTPPPMFRPMTPPTPLDNSPTDDVIDEALSANSEYKVGDRVHFRGDYKPSRIWTIQKIADKLITIVTEDTEGLDATNQIMVVYASEIFMVDGLVYGGGFGQGIGQGIGQGLGQGLGQGFGQSLGQGIGPNVLPLANSFVGGNGQPPIVVNFAPKFMNGGNDNSTGGQNDVPGSYDNNSAIPTMSNGGSENGFSFSQQGGGANSGGSRNDIVVKKASEEKKSDTLFSKAIDFTKGFFVTKKG
jgi:DNA-directed RNA polymerase II subunit RPB2